MKLFVWSASLWTHVIQFSSLKAIYVRITDGLLQELCVCKFKASASPSTQTRLLMSKTCLFMSNNKDALFNIRPLWLTSNYPPNANKIKEKKQNRGFYLSLLTNTQHVWIDVTYINSSFFNQVIIKNILHSSAFDIFYIFKDPESNIPCKIRKFFSLKWTEGNAQINNYYHEENILKVKQARKFIRFASKTEEE